MTTPEIERVEVRIALFKYELEEAKKVIKDLQRKLSQDKHKLKSLKAAEKLKNQKVPSAKAIKEHFACCLNCDPTKIK